MIELCLTVYIFTSPGNNHHHGDDPPGEVINGEVKEEGTDITETEMEDGTAISLHINVNMTLSNAWHKLIV